MFADYYEYAESPPFHKVEYVQDLRIHFVKSYSTNDCTIELDDGSFWKVNDFQMRKILSWASNDPLKITPSPWGFYNTYTISNQVTRDSVGADLVLGPVAFGPRTHWIVSIDSWNHRIYLEDGTYWDVRGLDFIYNWALYDTVIIGTAAYEWAGRCDSILINVNMNKYVYANQGIGIWSR